MIERKLREKGDQKVSRRKGSDQIMQRKGKDNQIMFVWEQKAEQK